jgi:hypothetical protein
MLLSKAGSEQRTAQGHEIQFGTNVLGHQLLVQALKPAILEAASHAEKDSVRVIFLSSSAHFILANKKLIEQWDLTNEATKTFSPQEMYGRSKLANIHQAHKFADEWSSKGVICASVHVSPRGDRPRNIKICLLFLIFYLILFIALSFNRWQPGNIRTELGESRRISVDRMMMNADQYTLMDDAARYGPAYQRLLLPLITWPVYYGTISQLYAGTAKGIENLQRSYYVPWAKQHEPYPPARDAALAQKTWDYCEEQTKGF